MQKGIRFVREGQQEEAYLTFREVVALNPANEYAWVWVSQTSPDLKERRSAIEKAFKLNPASVPARQALERLNRKITATPKLEPPPPKGTDWT